MLNHLTSAITNRVACEALHPMIRRSIAANQPHFSHYIAINGPAYANHPRADGIPLAPVCNWDRPTFRPNYWTTELAYDYTVLQATPQDISDMMSYFANHVRDALKFDY